MTAVDLDRARAAKERLRALLAGHRAVNGIGLSRVGAGYELKVNLSEAGAEGAVPPEVDGVPVRAETVGRLRRRRAP